MVKIQPEKISDFQAKILPRRATGMLSSSRSRQTAQNVKEKMYFCPRNQSTLVYKINKDVNIIFIRWLPKLIYYEVNII